MSSEPVEFETIVTASGTLVLVVEPTAPYTVERSWMGFDVRGPRAIDDLWFTPASDPEGSLPPRAIVLFQEAPVHSAQYVSVALPSQIALERVFFHSAGVGYIALNGVAEARSVTLSSLQSGIDQLSENGSKILLARENIACVIGRLEISGRGLADVAAAEKALKSGAYFQALARARECREKKERVDAFWIELLALSYLGLAEPALALYEQYPLRGDADPEAQLVAARFRLLLKQFNEARTILQTISFPDRFRAIALSELARSYLMSEEYSRALDVVEGALREDETLTEARLVRGLAKRGLSYAAGDEEGLTDALADFRWVASNGGVNSAEALFHAGTVLARLGRLEDAEGALRQSLFQRDRAASRDALVRVYIAQGRGDVARDELSILSLTHPTVSEVLRSAVEEISSTAGTIARRPLLFESSTSREALQAAAQELLKSWNLNLRGESSDFAYLDQFVNYCAPAGRFSAGMQYEFLNEVGIPTLARCLALHLAPILEREGVATWDVAPSVRVTANTGTVLPLESFVHDRILLGASGDNLTSLESIVFELTDEDAEVSPSVLKFPQTEATSQELEHYRAEADWARGVVKHLGVEMDGSLTDLIVIDQVIDTQFEPGGELRSQGGELSSETLDRFIRALGLLVGEVIAVNLPARWLSHPDIMGVTLEVFEIGRLYPLAKLQRRVLVAEAADYALRLDGLALSCAAARVLWEIVEQGLDEPEAIAERLTAVLPAFNDYDASERRSLAESLLVRAETLQTSIE